MRRSAVFSLVAGAAILAGGCSSDDQRPGPMEPAAVPAPDNQADIVLGCRNNGLIVVQLAAILSAKPPARLYQQAVVKFALVEFALLTKKKALAQARALDLIDFLIDNRGNLIPRTNPTTAIRLSNVIDAILCIVGLPPAGADLGPNTGIGVVPANNPTPVIITTPQGTAGLLVPTNFAPDEDVNGNPIPGVVVTVTGSLTTPLNTPLDQFGQTVDLTASQEVEWREGGVTVAICVSFDEELFDEVFPRLRVGHEGGLGPFFGAIEILPQADGDDVTAVIGTCNSGFGFRSGFGGLRSLAERVLLPAPLHAAVLLDKAGGVGGTTKRFSKFRAVDPELEVVALSPTSTSGTVGGPVAEPPSVLVRTQTLQTAIPGIDVEFEVPDGSPGEVDPTEVTTIGTGVAATDSWVLGSGENTVIATPQAPIPAITFTPPSITFTAVGQLPPPEFGASDWSYSIRNIVPESTVWTTLPWPVTEEGWSQGTAPFGSVPFPDPSPTSCDDEAETEWPVNKVILLRRDFFVPDNTLKATISVLIDNDVQVFLNGVPLTSVPVTHGGCAEITPPEPFTAFTGEGPLNENAVNQLAVLGIDHGVESFADVEVTLTPDD